MRWTKKLFVEGLSPNRETRKVFWRQLKLKFFPELQAEHKHSVDIFPLIEQARSEGRKVVCIMAPMFTEERLTDGYYRRIKAIDDILGPATLKIYMCADCKASEYKYTPIAKIVDHEHIRFIYLPWISEQRNYANRIADFADIVYHHSVGYMDDDIIRQKHLLKIVDLHGTLPEEFAMSGNYTMTQKENEHEELAMRYADYLVCVTNSMVKHLKNKYPQYQQRYIILPILDEETLLARVDCEQKPMDQGIVVTYAGGMQSWQMIPQMQQCMRSQPDFNYKIFTSDVEGFWRQWGDQPALDKMKITCVTPKQLKKEYVDCHYGFVLREDCAVNNVACPTKLIEYILFGIVPVLYTPHVGDFVMDGMQYISMEDFCKGRLPDEKMRTEIAAKNQEVIGRIIDKYKKGSCALKGVIQGK